MQSINTLWVSLGLLLTGVGAVPDVARAEAPTVAPMTVELVDEAGTRIADGFHTLTVSLFESWESDEPAFTETHHEVWVEHGHATIDVGSIRAIPFDLGSGVEVSVAVGQPGTGGTRAKFLQDLVVSAYIGPSSISNDASTVIQRELPDRWISSTTADYWSDVGWAVNLIEVKTRPFSFQEPGLNCNCSQDFWPYFSRCSVRGVEQDEDSSSWLITVETYALTSGFVIRNHLLCHGLTSPLITVTAP